MHWGGESRFIAGMRAVASLFLVCSVVVPAFAATSPAAPTPPALRLPTGVRPTRYALDLTIVPARAPYRGTVTIELAVDKPTSTVWLDATDLKIEAAELRQKGAVVPARVTMAPPDFVGFTFPSPLAAGPAELVVRFAGTMDTQKSRGIYRQNEGPGADDWYAYTFFEPTDARRAFPCFDEPAYKVPWQLTLHVPRGQVALANAPVEREADEADGMKAVTMRVSRPLPSYLVAFVVGPFELVDGGTAGRAHTRIRFVVPRGRGGETAYARSVTPRIVTLLEDWFDMPYPFAKLDVAVVPRFWGTMEHPGLVALGQPLTLIKPAEEGLERRERYANIAIHELAHYWFGDYVTCKWWDDVWLNESLGTWMDAKITDALEPAWKFKLARDAMSSAMAMAADAQPTAQRLRLPVETRDAIQNSFENGITYYKGDSVLRMLEHWVGAERLRQAIQAYLAAHAWGNADADDFLAALRQKLGAPAAEVMASFVEQPGVPLVSAAVACDGGRPRVTLSQRRFFAAGERPSTQTWKLPVCLRWGGQAGVDRRCVELTTPTAEVALPACPRWVMPNEDGAGYYRTRYDGAGLRALAAVFGTELTVRERMQLASDVGAVADAGQLPAGDALALVPTFLGDADLRVYRQGVGLLHLVRPRELPERLRPAFARAVEKLLGPRARTVGWAPRAGEDPEMARVRPMLLGLMAEEAHDRGIIAEAQKLADRWLADHATVAPDMVRPVLRLAALGGDAGYFDRLLAAARKTSDRRERGMLLATLGAFRAPALTERALALVVTPGFDLRETWPIVQTALGDRETRQRAWDFLKAHFDAIVGRMREDEVTWLFGGVPGAFCDEAHRRDLASFLGARAAAHPGAPHALDEALDHERTCEEAEARNRDAVARFLAQF